MSDLLWHLDGVMLRGVGRDRLAAVDLDIRAGVTAVVGCSGAGKTSLLNLLAGYERPDRGRVERIIGGEGMDVFWAPCDDGLWPHLTARQHLEAVAPRGARVDETIETMSLGDVAEALPDRMSQGQRSRLAVARALTAAPRVLLFDEPFAHVDAAQAAAGWHAVQAHLARTGASMVYTTHDPSLVLGFADRAVCLEDGRIVRDGDVDELYWRPDCERTMWLLGEGNWIDDDAADTWLDGGDGAPRGCRRPEQVRIEPRAESPIVVRAARFSGRITQADLYHEQRDRTRTFYHRPSADGLSTGMRVVLRLVILLLSAAAPMASLAGCGAAADAGPEPRRLDYWRIPPEGASIPAPRSVAIGPADEVVVLDNAGRLLIYDATGAHQHTWWMPDNSAGNPEGACWLRDGRIAVADTHYHQVVFFDDTGRVATTLGGPGEGEPGTFGFPVSIVEDDDGNLFVAEYGGGDRVQKFDREGRFLLAFGGVGTGPGHFQRAGGMVWREGRLFVADTTNHRVQIFDGKGDYLGMLGDDAIRFRFPYDVDVDSDGRAYVIEWGAGRLAILDADGALLGRFGSAGAGRGQFRTPWGVAVDRQGRVRVADTENRRVVSMVF